MYDIKTLNKRVNRIFSPNCMRIDPTKSFVAVVLKKNTQVIATTL